MGAAARSIDVPQCRVRGFLVEGTAPAIPLPLFVLGLVVSGCVSGEHDTDVSVEGDSAVSDATFQVDSAEQDSVGDTDSLPTAHELRAALGIPTDAARVLVFGQSAHLASSEEPMHEDVERIFVFEILSRALDALAADSAYHYAVAESGWLRRYWEDHPERHHAIRMFNREGRLAIIGGSVSSPDVVLPLGDNLLRDYRAGTRWLQAVGLERTSSAWLPDSNGLGATTPDLLSAAGFDAVAFWHADGADTIELPTSLEGFADLEHAPGSGADLLAAAMAVDFLWEGPGGARVFAHWMSHGYMLGDFLDYGRIDRFAPGQPEGVQLDQPSVLDNIQSIAALVLPVSPTDYGFVSVGGDFQYPKQDLARWMQAWNAERYASTDVWVVAATFDDFADLAMTQADRLAVRPIDLTPYTMGAFATHERMKGDARLASTALSQAEAVAAAAELEVDSIEFEQLTWMVSQTNHHDRITGLSAYGIFDGSQEETTRELREKAEALRDGLMGKLAQLVATDDLVLVNTDHHRQNARFTLPWDGPDGVVAIEGASVWERSRGYIEDGVLRGSASWLEPLSAETFTVWPWGAEGTPMTVRCLVNADAVPCSEADRIEVDQGPYSTLSFDRRSGGTLLSFDGTPDSSNLFTAPAFRLYDYLDEGGSATFAHELAEPVCGFTSLGEIVPTGPVAVEVRAHSEAVVVAFSWEQDGITWRRKYRIGRGQLDPIDVELTVGVAPGHAIVTRFDTRVKGDMWMAVPGGVVKRTNVMRFIPTFWPFERWTAKIEPNVATFGIISPSNPAVSFDQDGRIEVVLAREIGSDCEASDSGAFRAATLSMRIVSTYAHDVNGGVAATMDEFARDLYEPLLAARGVGQPAHLERGWITSISSSTTDAGDFDWRLRVARFAKTPEGYVLTLEKRMLAPRRMQVEMSTRFPADTVVEQLDATEQLDHVLVGVSPERFSVPMGNTYLTLRFRPPAETRGE